MLTEDRVRAALAEAHPALEVRSLRYFSAGWDYELWEINDELLARFPLRDDCAARLPVEARLLQELAAHVSVTTPAPLFSSDGVPSFPQPFFAYRKLPGEGMDTAHLDDGGRAVAARQLGRLLSDLHAFPTDRAVALRVPERAGERWRQRYVNLRPRVEQNVYPLLTSGQTGWLDAFWDTFLAREDIVTFASALIHGDLSLEHVLVDALGNITGVIDFGDARVGDPALDFAGFDESLRALVAGSYTREGDATMLERAAIYRDIMSPFNYVLFGQEHNEQSLIDRGLRRIRATLRGNGNPGQVP